MSPRISRRSRKAFKLTMGTVRHGKNGVMDEEYLFWNKQIGLGQQEDDMSRLGLQRVRKGLALLAVAGLFSIPGRAASPPSGATIKIGVVVATGGPAGLLGGSFLKAIQLAKEDLRRTAYRYELVTEEIPSPDKAEPAIRKLLDVDRVDAIIVGFSMSGQIVKPYAEAAKVPVFCICSVGSVGDELFTFTIMPLAEDEASRWVREAQRRGVQRIAVLAQDYPSIDNHVRMLKAESAKAGIAFVSESRFGASTADFRPAIEAARKASPDLYFIEAFNPALDVLGQQLADAGIHALASVVAFSISDRPRLFEGGWYTDSYVSPAFRARLDERYPSTRLVTHMMPYAYDSFRILVQGFESGKGILPFVRGMTEYDGTAGKITKAAGTGNFRSTPAVWVIRDGKPSLVP